MSGLVWWLTQEKEEDDDGVRRRNCIKDGQCLKRKEQRQRGVDVDGWSEMGAHTVSVRRRGILAPRVFRVRRFPVCIRLGSFGSWNEKVQGGTDYQEYKVPGVKIVVRRKRK